MKFAQIASMLALVTAAACGSNTVGASGPCDLNPPDPACSISCNGDDALCPAGFYCGSDGTCTADCIQGSSSCGPGFMCDPRGACVQATSDGDGGTTDPDASCPSIMVTPMANTPTVHLLIDRSGSMNSNFSGNTRWNAVRQALTGPSGVVTQLQDRVYFGATTYSNDRSGTCPDVVSTPTRAFGNRTAIDQLLQANLLTDTPTGESMDQVINGFMTVPPAAGSTPIILLATDGLPDTCANVNESPQAQALTIAAAQRAYGMGIRTFILSVGDQVGDAHLQQVANAGVGLDPATGTAPFYKANDPAQLAMQLQQIITGVLSCELDLNGSVDPTSPEAQMADVRLGGTPLMYGTDWDFVDGDTIRLTGAACTQFQAGGGALTATFACGAIIVN
ncbi:MAG: vWA domain-containing protein [Kofleriaceae bacterium]